MCEEVRGAITFAETRPLRGSVGVEIYFENRAFTGNDG
jgi:hypothetical protein